MLLPEILVDSQASCISSSLQAQQLSGGSFDLQVGHVNLNIVRLSWIFGKNAASASLVQSDVLVPVLLQAPNQTLGKLYTALHALLREQAACNCIMQHGAALSLHPQRLLDS